MFWNHEIPRVCFSRRPPQHLAPEGWVGETLWNAEYSGYSGIEALMASPGGISRALAFFGAVNVRAIAPPWVGCAPGAKAS
jgi:hypothetical protein